MHDIWPAYQFTIPSLADSTALDCRIYHPQSFVGEGIKATIKPWNPKAAIIGHPYAPLGGSMDDPVVLAAVEQLLDLDFVVGTFNFRGASGSRGSTSWTGKAERDDYVSFAGLVIHYMSRLQFPNVKDSFVEEHQQKVGARTETSPFTMLSPSHDCIEFIFGGYSYASLIVTHLPPVNMLPQCFSDASRKTSSTEIILRARSLAIQTNERLEEQQHSPRRGRQQRHSSYGFRNSNSHHSIVYGGHESSPDVHNASQTRRSIDSIPARIKDHIHIHRRSSHKSFTRRSSSYASRQSGSQSTAHDEGDVDWPEIKPHYLLISPLLPPLSSFLSYTSMASLLLLKNPEPDVLLDSPTLVVYGSKDGFTSAKKMSAWCKKMRTHARVSASFTWHEQAGAGHFWKEKGAADGLVRAIEAWVQNQLRISQSL